MKNKTHHQNDVTCFRSYIVTVIVRKSLKNQSPSQTTSKNLLEMGFS